MTVRIYRSTDASAPTLTGQAGSLTTLLDAVLVNGYGSMTAAGWTIGYTTTNKRAYLQNLTGANNASGMYLYVDDTAPGAGGAKEARSCGFETMSAITPTGTGQFPTSGQSAIGVGTLVIRKSATADATARAWTIVANGQTVYLLIETGDQTAPVAAFPFVFGDFFSYKTSDSYAVCIIARTAENQSTGNADPLHSLFSVNNTTMLSTGCIGHFAARSWTGVGGSVLVGKHIDQVKLACGTGGSINTGTTLFTSGVNCAMGRPAVVNAFPYPNGPDGACWISPIWLHHNNAVRGWLKGCWAPLHDRPLNHADTYTVSGGNLNGKSLIAQSIPVVIQGNTEVGQIHVETSDTWS